MLLVIEFGQKMARLVRSFIQFILKLVNSFIGMVGMAMILYAVWMIRDWEGHMAEQPFGGSDHPAPWYVFFFFLVSFGLRCVLLVFRIFHFGALWLLRKCGKGKGTRILNAA